MNYTPQQLAQALMSHVALYGAPGAAIDPQRTPLNPLQMQSQQGRSSMLDPSSLMKMFGGLMGGSGGTPPNPYASAGGGYMDAGSMPMSNTA